MTNEERTTALKFLASIRNLTLSDLAEQIGLSNNTFNSRLETWNTWTLSEIQNIAKACCMNMEAVGKLFFDYTEEAAI